MTNSADDTGIEFVPDSETESNGMLSPFPVGGLSKFIGSHCHHGPACSCLELSPILPIYKTRRFCDLEDNQNHDAACQAMETSESEASEILVSFGGQIAIGDLNASNSQVGPVWSTPAASRVGSPALFTCPGQYEIEEDVGSDLTGETVDPNAEETMDIGNNEQPTLLDPDEKYLTVEPEQTVNLVDGEETVDPDETLNMNPRGNGKTQGIDEGCKMVHIGHEVLDLEDDETTRPMCVDENGGMAREPLAPPDPLVPTNEETVSHETEEPLPQNLDEGPDISMTTFTPDFSSGISKMVSHILDKQLSSSAQHTRNLASQDINTVDIEHFLMPEQSETSLFVSQISDVPIGRATECFSPLLDLDKLVLLETLPSESQEINALLDCLSQFSCSEMPRSSVQDMPPSSVQDQVDSTNKAPAAPVLRPSASPDVSVIMPEGSPTQFLVPDGTRHSNTEIKSEGEKNKPQQEDASCGPGEDVPDIENENQMTSESIVSSPASVVIQEDTQTSAESQKSVVDIQDSSSNSADCTSEKERSPVSQTPSESADNAVTLVPETQLSTNSIGTQSPIPCTVKDEPESTFGNLDDTQNTIMRNSDNDMDGENSNMGSPSILRPLPKVGALRRQSDRSMQLKQTPKQKRRRAIQRKKSSFAFGPGNRPRSFNPRNNTANENNVIQKQHVDMMEMMNKVERDHHAVGDKIKDEKEDLDDIRTLLGGQKPILSQLAQTQRQQRNSLSFEMRKNIGSYRKEVLTNAVKLLNQRQKKLLALLQQHQKLRQRLKECESHREMETYQAPYPMDDSHSESPVQDHQTPGNGNQVVTGLPKDNHVTQEIVKQVVPVSGIARYQQKIDNTSNQQATTSACHRPVSSMVLDQDILLVPDTSHIQQQKTPAPDQQKVTVVKGLNSAVKTVSEPSTVSGIPPRKSFVPSPHVVRNQSRTILTNPPLTTVKHSGQHKVMVRSKTPQSPGDSQQQSTVTTMPSDSLPISEPNNNARGQPVIFKIVAPANPMSSTLPVTPSVANQMHPIQVRLPTRVPLPTPWKPRQANVSLPRTPSTVQSRMPIPAKAPLRPSNSLPEQFQPGLGRTMAIPESVTSEYPELKTLINAKKLTPGLRLLHIKGTSEYGNLLSNGFIQDQMGVIHKTPVSWCKAFALANPDVLSGIKGPIMRKDIAYKLVLYNGVPLSIYKVKSILMTDLQSTRETADVEVPDHVGNESNITQVQENVSAQDRSCTTSIAISEFNLAIRLKTRKCSVSLIDNSELNCDLPCDFWTNLAFALPRHIIDDLDW